MAKQPLIMFRMDDLNLPDDITEFDASPELRARLISVGRLKEFKRGEVILNEHSNIYAIPIITSGSIRVSRSDADGHEIFLYYINSGESCIMSFLGGMHHETSKVRAVAEEDTVILFIPVDKVSELMKDFPEWLDYIFRLYHKRFEELLEVINAVAFKKMDERLLDLLRLKSSQINSSVIPVTHEELATDLGTARVVVSRLLKQMETEGLVELGRNRVQLL